MVTSKEKGSHHLWGGILLILGFRLQRLTVRAMLSPVEVCMVLHWVVSDFGRRISGFFSGKLGENGADKFHFGHVSASLVICLCFRQRSYC